MRRRRIWFRRLGRAAGTIAIGATLGFLVPTVVAEYSPKPEVQQAEVAESPVARQFINAFALDDQPSLDAIGVSAEVKLRAARNRSDYIRVDPPVHLGSYVAGGFSLHAYASHVVKKDGTEDLIGWRFATGSGQVQIIDPPQAVRTP
jgi:hypothetical protein